MSTGIISQPNGSRSYFGESRTFSSGRDPEEFAWQDDALCAQTAPDLFFPEIGESTKDAKRLCGSCTVREQCLAYALKHEVQFGVWGGKDSRELRKMRMEAA